jgi:DNA-binding transcriptional regulator YiaG
MTPDQLKEHFNVETQTALAAKLGKPVSTVAEWFQKGRVPRAVLLEVELEQLKGEDRPQ